MTHRTITTDATGRSEAKPELATVEAAAIGEAESAATALAAARDRAESIRASVTTVADAQIRTTDRRVDHSSEVFDADPDAPYRAIERLDVTCDPEVVEPIVVAVTDAGGSVRTVQFHLRENAAHRLQDEALVDAMERAREKAEQLATAEGLTVGDVRDVTVEDMMTGMESIVDEALATGGDADLHPGLVSVSETVTVVYELLRE